MKIFQNDSLSGISNKIGKKTYLFDNGELLRNKLVKIEDEWYFSDADGIAINLGSDDGWRKAGENKYYIKEGELLRDTVAKIGDSYYGFDNSGIMYSGMDFEIRRKKDYYYRAKPSGKLYVNCWYTSTDWDEAVYYYGADGKAATGIKKINKKTYAFDDCGRMYSDTAVTINGISYAVSKNGQPTKLQGISRLASDGC